MATIVRYSWLKVIKTGAAAPAPQSAPPAVDFALWTSTAGALASFTTSDTPERALAPAPDPSVRLTGFDLSGTVGSACVDCPAQSPVQQRSLFVLQAPPLPTSGDAWGLEKGTGTSEGCEGDPQLAFAIRPVEGDHEAARNWMNSPEGADWCKGAATAVLISCVVQV